ncbi:MAG TPA: UDP-N-acetylglucosamine 2-epimerase (non-hydrolyzing) [Candidatus Eisenbacteria bacterium]|nr:UDP-N-acetylglucosamine 2-epimerase (non-hydrolyzing) [Candidatus Eisenbacteria bacterium]
MKVAIVVGTRPEIIKMAPVVRACAARGVPHVVLHTGQHYSFDMDGVFFEELELPRPQANLEVGSGSQAFQVGAIVSGMAPLLERERPDWVLVEGDTNSVLASALAAHKLGVRVGHVEAGLRSYDRRMPEEINRILTDHLADHLYAPTEHARATLRGEQVADARIRVTGNTVVDELLRQRPRAVARGAPARFGVRPGGYAVATVHRAENTDDAARLRGLVAGLSAAAAALGIEVLCAVHPRTTARLQALGLAWGERVRALPPLPYLDFLGLHAEAALTLTDSGGLQEEACTLGVPCVTLRDNTERPESVEAGANVLAGAEPARIVEAARAMRARARGWPNPFGDGHAAGRIVDALLAP